MTLIQNYGLPGFKQRLLSHEKVDFFKEWQLKISFVLKIKSFESNFGNVIPSGSTLSCLISAFGLGFNAWPYQHFIEFQHQQFSLCNKTFTFFFSAPIEYFSGRLDWFCLAFHQRLGATERPARKIRSSLPVQFGLRPRARLQGISLHNSRSRVRWTDFPGLFGLSNICQPTAFGPGNQGRVGTDNRELVC